LDDLRQGQSKVPAGESQERADLGQPTQVPLPPPTPCDRSPAVKSPGNSRGLIATVVALLIVGCLGLGVIGYFAIGAVMNSSVDHVFSAIGFDKSQLQAEPSYPVGGFYSALKEHDYELARTFLATDLARKYPPSELQARWQLLERARGEIRLQMDFSTLEEKDTTASMLISLVPSERDHFVVKLQMEKTNDTWKITTGSPALIPEP
jgi:hypothetical protein